MSFDEKEIENLRKVYNQEHSSEPPIPAGTMKSVWAAIRKRFHARCKASTECIIQSMIGKPKAPDTWMQNTHEWLSSLEIDQLESEYMKVFSDYYYVGSIPIDFDKKSLTGACLVSSLCSMDILKLYKKGYTQIGIVFNTDKSTGPGKHWVAVFCDIDPTLEYPRITYFDSYANKPEPEIQKLMKRWKDRWDSTGIHSKGMVTSYNKTRHQYQESECGMYTVYFHYCCLMGIPMENRIPDEVVRGMRGLLFRVGKK
jgi:hypothetical protein